MSRKVLPVYLLIVLLTAVSQSAEDLERSEIGSIAFKSGDLHLSGQNTTAYQLETGEHILIFRGDFSMTVGSNEFSADNSIVWLIRHQMEQNPQENAENIGYDVIVYLEGSISARKTNSVSTNGFIQTIVENPSDNTENMGISSRSTGALVRFVIDGEIFFTAETTESEDPRGSDFYKSAYRLVRQTGVGNSNDQLSPENVEQTVLEEELDIPRTESGLFDSIVETNLDMSYPITLSPVESETLPIISDSNSNTVVITDRFHLSQQQGSGSLLELQADNAILYLMPEDEEQTEQSMSLSGALSRGALKAIYLSGDVVMSEGQRIIRTDEIYYDMQEKKAIAVNFEMRNFDEIRGIPIYIRGEKLKQLAADKFTAENSTLTTSEFFLPQISLNASSIIITDTTVLDSQRGNVSNESFDVQLSDVSMNIYDTKVFSWPYLRTNMQRPDVPIKSIHLGHDNTWGTFMETRWYLARLLGLQEPEGTESTLALDYYSDRGFGGGFETEYERENYFGRILGYAIGDRGDDTLGRSSDRKNIEPPREFRGRFFWQHRQFLSYGWQLTTEASYISDKNFLESYYRSEFNIGKEQESLIYLKRIEDNWGLSFLGKVRLNDFENQLEELPTTQFHWTGQSFLEDRLTFYSDSQISRFRQRYSSDGTTTGSSEFYSFLTTRNEVDIPFSIEKVKIVPFMAFTAAYEDGMGFYRELDGGTGGREEDIWFGEAGIRITPEAYWKVFPAVNSKVWDLNQLRHIIEPHVTAVGFMQDESVIEQRDTINFGISQRLQTKRGPEDNQHTVDWMKLDLDFVWVNNSGDTSAGPDQFLWNRPFIPLVNRFSTTIPPKDRRGSNIYGPRRNYLEADYIWNMSDTTALLSEMNYDMQSGVVQQYNVGFSHIRWPNLNYYIGNRYLRRLENGYGEKGSNALTFALTFLLDPRYTLVYSGQVDLDYDATIWNEVTLVRQYHRLYWSITYSTDESLDRQSVVFSLWPQGVPDFGIGPSRYTELGGSAGF